VQRFIALSLALHGLAIAGWYRLDMQPQATDVARTLALTLQAPDTAAPAGSAQTPPETIRPHPVPGGQPAALTKPAGRQAETQQRRMQAPATSTQPPAGHGSDSMADLATRTRQATGHEPATAAVPSGTTPAAADDMPARQALQTAVATAFRANFRYPRIARRNGWEGTVVIALRVLPDGRLTDILVSSSSGHPVLDRAAVQTLQTASVPQAGQWLNGRTCELVIPVEYHLLDS